MTWFRRNESGAMSGWDDDYDEHGSSASPNYNVVSDHDPDSAGRRRMRRHVKVLFLRLRRRHMRTVLAVIGLTLLGVWVSFAYYTRSAIQPPPNPAVEVQDFGRLAARVLFPLFFFGALAWSWWFLRNARPTKKGGSS
jgi:hypothetical protein